MNERQMEHLGDGLCADFDGERVRLFAPQEQGIIEVYFSQPVLLAFLSYVARVGFWQPVEQINKPPLESGGNGE